MTSKEKIIGQWEGKISFFGLEANIGSGQFNDFLHRDVIDVLIRRSINSDLDDLKISKSKYKLTLSIIEDDVK